MRSPTSSYSTFKASSENQLTSALHSDNKKTTGENAPLERVASAYTPLHTFALPPAKQYQQQFADMYFLRHTKLRAATDSAGHLAWSDFSLGGQSAKKVDRVLDVRQGELCWVTGTVYVDMPMKPNIMDDISRDHWAAAVPTRDKLISADGKDVAMLEDESGRLRLMGQGLAGEMIVTGTVICVLGTENKNGDFEVIDLRFPDLAPQAPRWAATGGPPENEELEDGRKAKKRRTSTKVESPDDEDEKMSDIQDRPSTKIAIVSGLGITCSHSHAIELDLLLEYLLGESLSDGLQSHSTTISRLIIAGNSLNLSEDINTTGTLGQPKKAVKKYGYDAASYNPAPIQHLDTFLSTVLDSLPVTLIPGEHDPANASIPQQRIHAAMFPQSRAYAAQPTADGMDGSEGGDAGWFDAVTNPWEGEVEGWRCLVTGGQNVDDVYKYVEGESRTEMMEYMCRWRCVAPTAPDTLCKFARP